MKAPKRESAGQYQEHNGENTPRNPTIAPAFLLGFRHPLRQGWEYRGVWRRRFRQAGFGGRHEVRDSLGFVHAQMAGLGGDKALIEDVDGKLIGAVLFNVG